MHHADATAARATRTARAAPPAPSTMALPDYRTRPAPGVQIAKKTKIIGIGAEYPAVVDHQRIDRADGPGQRIDAVAQGKHRFLVRNGDIAAGEFAVAQALEKALQRVGRDIDRFIAAIDAVLGQPGAVNQGRAGMVNGMADDEGFGGQIAWSLPSNRGRDRAAPPAKAAKASPEW